MMERTGICKINTNGFPRNKNLEVVRRDLKKIMGFPGHSLHSWTEGDITIMIMIIKTEVAGLHGPSVRRSSLCQLEFQFHQMRRRCYPETFVDGPMLLHYCWAAVRDL